ncbi:MAG: cupin domain-containing protein [Deltaproteobacteria bacterium]|nr:cupin domain-containing protein [Deltaproteobacteria bacterium]
MKVENLDQGKFDPAKVSKFLVHDSPYFRIINFNFRAGQELPVHNHDVEGQLSIQVVEGEGWFLGEGGSATDARAGDILICDIAEPHGVRAKTDMRIIVTIAPPL